MNSLNIKVPKGITISVIGDVHEHPEQFFKMLDIIKPSENRWFVSVGDLADKGFGIKAFELMTDKLIELQNNGYGFAVPGNHELKLCKKYKHNPSKQLKWWKKQPLALSFEFQNGNRLTVVHAGVSPKMTWESLENDVEVCYIRDVDADGKMIPLKWETINGEKVLVKARSGGCSWHEIYDGRFGYIAAGHAAQKDGDAKYYNFSCNLDSCVYETGILTAEVFNDLGNRQETIRVSGTPFKPNIKINY